MKTWKIFCVCIMAGSLILSTSLVYAGPNGKGKGLGKDKAKGNSEEKQQVNNGQAKGNSGSAPGQLKARNASKGATGKGREKANLRANRPERSERGRSAEHSKAKAGKDRLTGLFFAFEKAKWSHNPHDDRGQGNNGKPNMRDPYGHDKDSERVGSDRGKDLLGRYRGRSAQNAGRCRGLDVLRGQQDMDQRQQNP